jgi:hydrogenase expression/formation protein HypD
MDATLFDSFRDPKLARELLEAIHTLAARVPGPVRLMEVCGTHTVAIARGGFRSVLPENIKLISGPGCPVCVTANRDIDRVIALTRVPNVTVATFGDMVRVPGSSSTLARRRAEGATVEIVYSPLDALRLAQDRVGSDVVFVGVGFETTTPLVAATIGRAAALGLKNFSVIAAHKRVPPALEALVNDPEVALDALILPGHVSTILGVEPYAFLADRYGIPGVVTGFEPVDVLQGIAQLLEQIAGSGAGGAARAGQAGQAAQASSAAPAAQTARVPRAAIEIAYRRGVMAQGNPVAREAIDRVFDVCDAEWRGLGRIPASGYVIRDEFAAFDATRRFELSVEPTVEARGCRCGDVLRGVIPPIACPLFDRVCTPANPIGPCMVSSEGSCAAYHRYQVRD